ncbi:MAG: sigma-70 family RNA polymerase sigma factor [Deltaproteobacteria bacterium]|nr:sigma-70 family RNA polymerase sigma factor [Deltaproteobacteria bacterium]
MGMPKKQDTGSVRFLGDDSALTIALKNRQQSAQEELYHRYSAHVRGVLVRVLGTNVDVKDHLHNTFVQIFTSIDTIRNGTCLKQWLTTVTVYTAIGYIKASQRKKWLTFVGPEDVPEQEFESAKPEQREAVRQVYAVLERMNAEDRAIFCLRVIEGMPLKELSDIFDVSLATIKRRISHAQNRFAFYIRTNPALAEWIQTAPETHFLTKNA